MEELLVCVESDKLGHGSESYNSRAHHESYHLLLFSVTFEVHTRD